MTKGLAQRTDSSSPPPATPESRQIRVPSPSILEDLGSLPDLTHDDVDKVISEISAAERVYATLQLRNAIFGQMDQRTLAIVMRLETSNVCYVMQFLYRRISWLLLRRMNNKTVRYMPFMLISAHARAAFDGFDSTCT